MIKRLVSTTKALSTRSLRVLGAFVVIVGCFLVSTSVSYAEQIQRFESDIGVARDGTVTVTETITYQFTDARHGIFREIPRLHPDASRYFYKERYTDIEILSVTLDTLPVPYETTYGRDRVSIKIGNPESVIEGEHVYTIVYQVRGGISTPGNQGVELYFNVTGNDWVVPMRSVVAHVRGDEGVLLATRSCYRGYVDVSIGSCNIDTDTEGVVRMSAEYLNPGEGVTVAQALNPSVVVPLKNERVKLAWLLLFGCAVVGGVLGYLAYRVKTKHRTDAPIIPFYEPYPEAKPMYTGLLMDGRLDARDITAGILYLAREGYLAIRRTEKKVLFFFDVDDYEVTLKKVPAEDGSFFEARLIILLFGDTPAPATAVTLSELKNNLTKQKENLALLRELRKDLDEDLVTDGFFQHPFTMVGMILGVVAAVLLGTVFLVFFMDAEIVPSIMALGGLGVVAAVFLNRRRTKKGYEALDHLKGFKLFLSMTDRDRFAFHNAPEKNPQEFMEYLPYAVAFGVEKEWAKVFEGMTIPNPDWYSGNVPGSFTASSLTSSLGAFSTAFAASAGSSPSSGGGSVGGGSGGGGGGSW